MTIVLLYATTEHTELIKVRFYVQLETKCVTSETFFAANLLA